MQDSDLTLGSVTLRRNILLSKKMYFSALIQSGTTKRIVSFAVCTLRHPELKEILSCYSSTYFRSIFMQIDVFVKNSSGVAMSEISLVNFNLQLILSLE